MRTQSSRKPEERGAEQLQVTVQRLVDELTAQPQLHSQTGIRALLLLLSSSYVRNELKCEDLGELLSPWTFLSSLANICTACYCGIVLTQGEIAVSEATILAFACAAFLQWLTLVQYLRHHAHFYIVMRTLARGMPALLQFLIGVVPIFIASTVFACSLFGVNTIRFDGLVRSAITLFAVSPGRITLKSLLKDCRYTCHLQVLNGDVVRETFQVTLANEYTWFTQAIVQAFLYFFISMFIYVGKCLCKVQCVF